MRAVHARSSLERTQLAGDRGAVHVVHQSPDIPQLTAQRPELADASGLEHSLEQLLGQLELCKLDGGEQRELLAQVLQSEAFAFALSSTDRGRIVRRPRRTALFGRAGHRWYHTNARRRHAARSPEQYPQPIAPCQAASFPTASMSC